MLYQSTPNALEPMLPPGLPFIGEPNICQPKSCQGAVGEVFFGRPYSTPCQSTPNGTESMQVESQEYYVSRFKDINAKWVARYSKQATKSFALWNDHCSKETKEIENNCTEIGTLMVVYSALSFLHLLTVL